MQPTISLRGLSLHNLKAIDVDLPTGLMITITGPSGAGKSSLALDTLYAEAQRRYIETFSPYARQFLERLPRPPARAIENLPAAIAISQANPVRSARSTVGTLAEITYPTRHLFFRAAQLFCPGCGRPVLDQAPGDVASLLEQKKEEGQEGVAVITARVPSGRISELVAAGYFRELVGQEVRELSPAGWGRSGDVELVIDRIPLASAVSARIADSVEQAYGIGGGRLAVHMPDGEVIRASRGRHCPECDRSFPSPNPNLFSFNSPVGACPRCQGFGRILSIDWDLVVPDPSLTLAQGAIRPFENWEEEKAELMEWCRNKGIPTDRPWRDLPEDVQRGILFGQEGWGGVNAVFEYLETKRYKSHIRILLSRYRAYHTCPECGGSRFRPETGWYRLNGLRIFDFYSLDIKGALSWVEGLRSKSGYDPAVRQLVDDLFSRLRTLLRSGLDYLTLDRQSRTLSGGEVARVAISRAIGTELSETLYVLDEPTGGLHPMDKVRILGLMKDLKAQRNTVIAVEHDPGIVSASDLEVELGPGSGDRGGEITYMGPPRPRPAQAVHLGREERRPPSSRRISLCGVRANNLAGIHVSFPVNRITTVTGVSGSGKSTLVEGVLYRALLRAKGVPTEPPGPFDSIIGVEYVRDVVLVDQSPLGRTPRACPASYLHALDGIRRLLAETREARGLGLGPGAFSFNSAAGRCEACKGQGSEVIEMQFLPDITLPCPVCHGTRFSRKVLSVRWEGLTIHDILELTIDEAAERFSHLSGISWPLGVAIDLGLGHLRLGQPVNTLSGGEAQRLKLARFLAKGIKKDDLFILDEPSRGLSCQETDLVVQAMRRITHSGGTVVAVEHDLSVVMASDWVIDLGPGGGDQGGRVVYEGPPEGLSACPASLTGAVLRKGHVEPEAPSASAVSPVEDRILIQGARHHNLKDITVSIPKGRFVVVTGVSGSGKSSLAFDIVFAEGQRRYVEGLSSYMRQFIRLYERPDVDRIQGLTPTVAIEQRTSAAGPKSTVATLTEIAHYLRLLYARVSSPVCPSCGRQMASMDEEILVQELVSALRNRGAILLAPRVRRRKGWHQPELDAALRAGVRRVRIDGEMYRIPPIPRLSRFGEHTIEWVMTDIARNDPPESLARRAMAAGDGDVIIIEADGRESFVSRRWSCPECRIGLPEPDPLLFSFNTKAGACPRCAGMGMDPETEEVCPECSGTRLAPEARVWRIAGQGIAEFCALEVDEALKVLEGWLEERPWPRRLDEAAAPLVSAAISRLGFLSNVGLGYLSLDRAGDTLSGGEAQRIRLAAQIGSGLTGLTIVLDEPTIGLHPRDNRRLLDSLRTLCDRGNTVLVVEHDEETIREADWIVDLGPGGGTGGGYVVAQGTYAEILANPASETGRAFADPALGRLRERVRGPSSWIHLRGASCNNISRMDLSIPLGVFVCVTGVSGSGKSTLVSRILAPTVEARIGSPTSPPVRCEVAEGVDAVSRLAVVDHSPIGRTPRSCPATYVGILGAIRELFAQVPAARGRGFGPSRFSFNTEEGRCPACAGQGSQKISLGFLPDVYITCDECGGRRYEPATLEIAWRGKDISQILEMTFEEARNFFSPVPFLFRTISLVCELGLGYLTLGQPSPTLSGGEAQRLKIVRELAHPGRGMTLYLLDEPTTGLHRRDVARLVDHLSRLVDAGNSVVVIEHNLDVMKAADWIIDLGPQGGRQGGKVLFSGPVREFLASDVPSATRDALLRSLERKKDNDR
ncbi:MAG: excinuclease ABC subunit UvrA [Deltaproteobacteria bacterium]